MKPSAERGQAALEAIGALSTLALFFFMLLTVCYLLFARAWVQYQSEQALYCLAESRPSWTCRRELETNLKRLTPGSTRGLSVFALNGTWIVQFEWMLLSPRPAERRLWNWPNFILRVHKSLSTKKIVKNRTDLRL